MLGAERDHKVTVWGQQYTVTVYQKSKSVWVAVGDYMGKPFEIKARSAGAAVDAWKLEAEYEGDK